MHVGEIFHVAVMVTFLISSHSVVEDTHMKHFHSFVVLLIDRNIICNIKS